jgi:alkylated DNA repair dioxygenase AlkB
MPTTPAEAGLSGATFERTWLDDGSWVDVARGWLTEPDLVFQRVRDRVSWQQGRVFRYERWVDEPRLGGGMPAGSALPHPAIAETRRVLQHHYGVELGRPGLAYYRDGRDLMAFHRDRDMRWLDDTVIALLVLGARRPFHLRPRANRYDHDADLKGATHDFAPGEGDLLVMGGACQVGWEHSVPPAPGVSGGRISVQWRWTSRRGRPVVGASYRAPRTYSR